VAYSNLDQPELAAEYVTKAYALRERVSQRENLYLMAHYHDMVTFDLSHTIQSYQTFAQIYPRELTPHINLSAVYTTSGDYETMAIGWSSP
jgi:hypothetical protein